MLLGPQKCQKRDNMRQMGGHKTTKFRYVSKSGDSDRNRDTGELVISKFLEKGGMAHFYKGGGGKPKRGRGGK